MRECIFRQYDIRGKVPAEMPIDQVYQLTQAIAYYFLQQNSAVKTVVLGADGRTHSPAIKHYVIQALQDAGMNVIDIGTCPTPIMYFSLHTMNAVDAGLMITASHNGKEYNGIKICLFKDSVWGEQIQIIKNLFYQGVTIKSPIRGTYEQCDVISKYITWMVEQFPLLRNRDISAVIDCGNGAAGTVLPQLVNAMGWRNVQLLYPEVDGNYPNHEADPTVEKNMLDIRKILQTTSIQIGLGLDGDCDRMTPMSKKGILIQGDKLLALFAQPIIKKNPGAAIIFDIKCSSVLIDLLKTWGASPCISPSGHSIIKDQMKKNNGLLAGELSCHFFFNDRYFGYDDGIYAILRLFELLSDEEKTLDQLLEIFPKVYGTAEIRIDCSDDKKEQVVNNVKAALIAQKGFDVITIDGIRISTPHSWAILRSSNTQPVLCLRFEADSLQELKIIENTFIQLLSPYYDDVFLREQIYHG